MKVPHPVISDEVVKTLREVGYTFFKPGSEYCLEIIAKKEGVTLVIKTLNNVDTAKKADMEDLQSLAQIFSASPIVIGSKMQKGEVEPDTLYERFGVNVISLKTFEDAAVGIRFPHIYSKRGGLYAKVDGSRLRKLREEHGMSLGDMAKNIGVSRKAVYEYEHDQMGATLRTIAKIEALLKTDIMEGINPFRWECGKAPVERSPAAETACKLHSKLKKIGYNAMGFKRAPIDIYVKNVGICFVTDENLTEDGLERKIEAALGMSRISGAEPVLVASDKRPADHDISVIKVDDFSRLEKIGDLERLLSCDSKIN